MSLPTAKVLVLAAHEPELSGLTAALGEQLGGRLGETQLLASPAGIGLAQAAAGSARAITRFRPDAVILLGSCGRYPGTIELVPGQVCVASHIQAVDLALATGGAALPGPIAQELEPDRALSDGLKSAGDTQWARVATTLGITTSDEVAERLSQAGKWQVETMEALGVAHACAAESVPLAVVLGVTNMVGAQGRTQWLEHRRAAAQACCDLVISWATSGARGLPTRS